MENSSRLEMVNALPVDYLKRFSYDDLMSFTNGFKTIIGSGGFGKVYIGKFHNGMQIAVKVLNELYVTEDLFMDEVRIMGVTYHHRLVRFLGYCSDGNKKGLVYEYMENGSLDKILYMKDRPVEWNNLYDIMINTAKGISYLHDKRIIHHDIKPANILLDSEFSPKVADFGLAKLMNKDVTHVTASYGRGTRGYVAPEMAVLPFSHVTHKCDVYSFGMMLFDILGMSSLNQNDEWFLEIVWERFQNGQLDKIIKDCGIEEKDKKRANILSKVAFWCTQYTPRTRPPMSVVVKMLKGELQVMTPPNPLLPSSEYTMQPLTEAYEDKVSDKKMEDKILTQPENEDLKLIEIERATPVINSRMESSNNLARYDFGSYDKRSDVEIVIDYVMEDHGFSSRIPVAAILMYKCILKWCSEILQPLPMDMLVDSIGSAIENQYNKDRVSYWLSNTSTLLFLLERSFNVKIRNTSHSTSSDQSAPDIVQQVQVGRVNRPVMFFKQELKSCLKKAYEIVRDHLNEDLRSSLSLCIQAPTTTSWRADWKASVTSSANDSPTSHWRSIISTLDVCLTKLQDNFVPRVLTSKIFTQAFYDINLQLFNSILTNHECCSLGYGEYLKVGMYELDHWCDLAKNYVDFPWDQLKPTRQAIEFLVIVDKSKISLGVLTQSVCPTLSCPQRYGICRIFRDNENNTRNVSSDLVDKLKKSRDAERNAGYNTPYLLEKNPYLFEYFVDYEIANIVSELEKTDFSNITLNVEIPRHPRFEFLNVQMEMYGRDASFEF